MKNRCACVIRLLLCIVGTLVLAGCNDGKQVASDLEVASAQLDDTGISADSAVQPTPSPSPSGPSGNGNHGFRPPMDATVARSILREHAIAHAFPGDPADGRKFAELEKTESYQQLLADARSAYQEPAATAEAARQWTETLAAAKRQAIAAEAERYLLRATADFERATAAGALARIAHGEAALEVFHGDLGTLLPADVHLPANRFLLATPPHLEKARDQLRQSLNRLKETDALIPDGTQIGAIDALTKKLAEIDAAIASPERAAFQADCQHFFKKIPPEKWLSAAGTRPQRVQARFEKLLAETVVETGLHELLTVNRRPRGPPDTLAKIFAHDHDIDPAGWAEAKAELNAWDEQLRNDPNVPEDLRQPEIDPCRRIATTLEDATLEGIERDAARMIKPDGTQMPSELLLPEKQELARQWQQAAAQELVRRRAGGKQVPVDIARFSAPSQAEKARVDAHLVHVAFEQFPAGADMPSELRDRVQHIAADTVREYTERTSANLERFSALTRRIVISSHLPSDLEKQQYALAKEKIHSAASQTRQIIEEAKARGINVEVDKKRLDVALALFPGPLDPPGQSPGPENPNHPPDPGPPSPVRPDGPGQPGQPLTSVEPLKPATVNTQINRYQTGIESDLQVFNQTMTSLEGATANVKPLDVQPIGTTKGRFTASEESLRSPSFRSKKIVLDDTLNRLPASLEKWSGRLNGSEPFLYDEVKHPKSFKALGGGIHLGETAEYTDGQDLRQTVLVYEQGKGLLLRDGRTGKEWIVEAQMDPTSLRALYRFALAGRNAAVSIGWGQETLSLAQKLRESQNGEEAVLLDPFLVDTAVGQDLIVSDTIPWSLDKVNGDRKQPVSFQKEFTEANSTWGDAGKRQILAFVETVKHVPPSGAKTLAPRLASMNISPMVLLLFQFDSPNDEAVGWVMDREIEEVLRQAGNLSTIDPGPGAITPVQRLSDYLTTKYSTEIETQFDASNPGVSIDRRKVRVYARREANKAVEKMKTELQAEVAKLYKGDLAKNRLQVLQELALSSLDETEKPNRALVEAWVALALGQGQKKEAVADILLLFVNATTLATLYDDHVSFGLRDGTVDFTTRMRYRYATTHIEISDQRIGVGRDAQGSEVQTIDGLTNLVNANLPELIQKFACLGRIERCADLAAFFRWAGAAEKSGILGLVDLSGLLAAKSNDREKYPTVDAIKRN